MSRPPITYAVDLCLRMMLRAAFDYERNRTGPEIQALLLDWFTQPEIDAALAMISKGQGIPPAVDLSLYEAEA